MGSVERCDFILARRKAFQRRMVVIAASPCDGASCHPTVHFKRVKIVSFMSHVFYRN